MLAPGFEPGSMDRESIMMDLATPRERNRASALSMINGTEREVHFHFHSPVFTLLISVRYRKLMGDMRSNEPQTAAESNNELVWAWRVAPAQTGRCLPVLTGVVG